MMECRWWDSNPHGFPNDFESFASAIPPHRLIFNFETLVPVSEDWRDVQEGCKKSCFDKPSKFNAHSWISRTDKKNHEADFESPSSAIPTHRRMFFENPNNWYHIISVSKMQHYFFYICCFLVSGIFSIEKQTTFTIWHRYLRSALFLFLVYSYFSFIFLLFPFSICFSYYFW